MNNIRQHIKNVLVEEKTNKEVNLVKQMIYDLFDEVTSIEVSEYDDKPMLTINLISDSNAANKNTWYDEHISDEIMQLTGGHLVVCPYWTFNSDFRRKIADAYIRTKVTRIKDNKVNLIDESEELKNPYLKYEKLINNLVYMVFDKGICGFEWEVVKLHMREGISIRIILHFTEDSFRDFDYERYGKSKQELKVLIEDFLPKFDGIYIAYDTTKCKDEMNESELKERCWKGYTQKGMKTMFGKRYPNCVKIKKKKSLRESIKNMLDEEVTKKYPKPNEKLDKVVYKWLDNYFEGSQIYDREYWKYHGFQYNFCKNGREIADLRIAFDDKSPDWGPSDKRPTSERSVEEVMLYIYPIMIDELITDIPIRKNYLLYLIEEWFEDTQLDKIQQDFNRNDFSLDYITVFSSKKRGDICVPPVQKPEGVTMQEMMDYIKKNTLYSYKEMEKREEEEPGWIEDLYLGKLWGKEHERVNQEDRENNP